MWVLAVVVLPACLGGGSPGTNPPPIADDEPGGLPTPECGTACEFAGQCVGCRFSDQLCFGPSSTFSFGNGSCTVVPPPAGNFAFTIDGTSVTASSAAAVVDGGTLEIVANARDHAISLLVPATIGTTSCATTPTPLVVINLASPTGSNANRPVAGRPPCSITITAIGELGGRVEGTFTAEVPTPSGTGTVSITDGAFSVVRVVGP